MVSVAFAIGLFLNRLVKAPWGRAGTASGQKRSRRKEPVAWASRHPMQQATCQFARLFDSTLASILHGKRAGRSDDVDDVSGLSEPHGPDGSMAERGCIGAEISQFRSARCLGPAVRTAGRRSGADLAHVA